MLIKQQLSGHFSLLGTGIAEIKDDMDTVCSVVLPVSERTHVETREIYEEVLQIRCHQHWAMLIVPGLFLAAWLGMGLLFASIITNTFDIFGQAEMTGAPELISKTFLISAVLIALLYLHSYSRSSIRLTNRRALVIAGPLFSGAGQIELRSVHTIALRESFLGRMFNFGTISIVGAADGNLRLRYVPNAKEFYERLNGLLNGDHEAPTRLAATRYSISSVTS